jgi:Leucine-rich repeat (LRR) protein
VCFVVYYHSLTVTHTHTHMLIPFSCTALIVFSLGPFTSLNELILNRVPPSTVEDIYSFRQRIHRLEVINSGIPELRKFLAPIKRKYWAHFKPMHIGISPSLHHVFPEYKDDSEHPSRSQSIDKNGALVTTGDDEADAYLKNCWLELTHLRLCNCGIARLDPSLHFLPHLKMLDLSHNDLSHVIHLHDCPNLTMLNLAHNRIRVLSNLSLVVGGIQRLNLSHNEISMLDGIENLRHLTKLDLSHNLIDDIGEVDHLVGLEELQELFLSGNPLAASRHTAGVSTAQEQHYRCEVFGCFMHDCSIQQRPLPLLDGTEMSVDEELKIK